MSVFSGGISVKLDTDSHHTRFSRWEVKGYAIMAENTVRRCDVEARLFDYRRYLLYYSVRINAFYIYRVAQKVRTLSVSFILNRVLLLTELPERLYKVSSKIFSYVRRELQVRISRRLLCGKLSWLHIIAYTCSTSVQAADVRSWQVLDIKVYSETHSVAPHFHRATACNVTHGIAKAFSSVCPSVCRARGLRQNERNLCPHSHTAWKIIHPSFLTRRKVGGVTPSTWHFGANWPCWSENADFQSIFARSFSAVTPNEKVQFHYAFSNDLKMDIVLCF